VNLGLAFYGRSFTLEDSSCKTPGCPFSSGGTAGSCTATSGILSDSEIRSIITQYDLTPTLDSDAAVKYAPLQTKLTRFIVPRVTLSPLLHLRFAIQESADTAATRYMSWNDNQWVSYDDNETFALKTAYANKLCLGGTMVWALDLDTPITSDSVTNLKSYGLSSEKVVQEAAVASSNAATMGIFWTVCLPPGTVNHCPTGYTELLSGHGKVFDADLGHLSGEGCHGKPYGFI